MQSPVFFTKEGSMLLQNDIDRKPLEMKKRGEAILKGLKPISSVSQPALIKKKRPRRIKPLKAVGEPALGKAVSKKTKAAWRASPTDWVWHQKQKGAQDVRALVIPSLSIEETMGRNASECEDFASQQLHAQLLLKEVCSSTSLLKYPHPQRAAVASDVLMKLAAGRQARLHDPAILKLLATEILRSTYRQFDSIFREGTFTVSPDHLLHLGEPYFEVVNRLEPELEKVKQKLSLWENKRNSMQTILRQSQVCLKLAIKCWHEVVKKFCLDQWTLFLDMKKSVIRRFQRRRLKVWFRGWRSRVVHTKMLKSVIYGSYAENSESQKKGGFDRSSIVSLPAMQSLSLREKSTVLKAIEPLSAQERHVCLAALMAIPPDEKSEFVATLDALAPHEQQAFVKALTTLQQKQFQFVQQVSGMTKVERKVVLDAMPGAGSGGAQPGGDGQVSGKQAGIDRMVYIGALCGDDASSKNLAQALTDLSPEEARAALSMYMGLCDSSRGAFVETLSSMSETQKERFIRESRDLPISHLSNSVAGSRKRLLQEEVTGCLPAEEAKALRQIVSGLAEDSDASSVACAVSLLGDNQPLLARRLVRAIGACPNDAQQRLLAETLGACAGDGALQAAVAEALAAMGDADRARMLTALGDLPAQERARFMKGMRRMKRASALEFYEYAAAKLSQPAIAPDPVLTAADGSKSQSRETGKRTGSSTVSAAVPTASVGRRTTPGVGGVGGVGGLGGLGLEKGLLRAGLSEGQRADVQRFLQGAAEGDRERFARLMASSEGGEGDADGGGLSHAQKQALVTKMCELPPEDQSTLTQLLAAVPSEQQNCVLAFIQSEGNKTFLNTEPNSICGRLMGSDGDGENDLVNAIDGLGPKLGCQLLEILAATEDELGLGSTDKLLRAIVDARCGDDEKQAMMDALSAISRLEPPAKQRLSECFSQLDPAQATAMLLDLGREFSEVAREPTAAASRLEAQLQQYHELANNPGQLAEVIQSTANVRLDEAVAEIQTQMPEQLQQAVAATSKEMDLRTKNNFVQCLAHFDEEDQAMLVQICQDMNSETTGSFVDALSSLPPEKRGDFMRLFNGIGADGAGALSSLSAEDAKEILDRMSQASPSQRVELMELLSSTAGAAQKRAALLQTMRATRALPAREQSKMLKALSQIDDEDERHELLRQLSAMPEAERSGIMQALGSARQSDQRAELLKRMSAMPAEGRQKIAALLSNAATDPSEQAALLKYLTSTSVEQVSVAGARAFLALSEDQQSDAALSTDVNQAVQAAQELDPMQLTRRLSRKVSFKHGMGQQNGIASAGGGLRSSSARQDEAGPKFVRAQQGEVEKLQTKVEVLEGLLIRTAKSTTLHRGDHVRVLAGDFMGETGKLVESHADGMHSVKLNKTNEVFQLQAYYLEKYRSAGPARDEGPQWGGKRLSSGPMSMKSPKSIQMLIGEIYMKKILSDKIDDRAAAPRESLASFVRSYILKKYGKKQLVDQHLRGVVDAIAKNSASGGRIALFGRLAGVIDTDAYDPTQCDLILELLRELFPDSEKLKKIMEKGDGNTKVTLRQVVKACNCAFPPKGSERAMKLHLLPLDYDLREKFERSIMELAGVNASNVNVKSNANDAPAPPDKSPKHKPAVAEEAGAEAPSPTSGPKQRTRRSSVIKIESAHSRAQVCLDKLLELCHMTFVDQCERENDRLTACFKECDDDGDGYLDFNEFTVLISKCDKDGPIHPRELERMFMEASDLLNDADEEEGSGTVNMQEFRILAKMCTRHGITVHRDATAEPPPASVLANFPLSPSPSPSPSPTPTPTPTPTQPTETGGGRALCE